MVKKPLSDRRARRVAAYRALADAGAPPMLMVGYNRRFAPMVANQAPSGCHPGTPLRPLYGERRYLPADHWTQDPEVGGGQLGRLSLYRSGLHLVVAPLRVTTRACRTPAATTGTTYVTIECENGSWPPSRT